MPWASKLRAEGLERLLRGLDALAARRGRISTFAPHLLTGIEGEEAACFHLLRAGYTVVARRWSSGSQPGDLDLVAWLGSVLCFVEVKTRTTRDLNPAEASVDPRKRTVLRRLARQYIRQMNWAAQPEVRFDVVSVYLEPGCAAECHHFENAFGWDERRGDDRER
jgi:putative endonuclease